MKVTGLLALLVSGFLLLSPVQADSNTVNINKASAQTLAEDLEGIGLAKATAIVDYRDKNGPFKSVEDLTLVKGVGLKTIEVNRSRIRLADDQSMTTGNVSASKPGKSKSPR